LRVKKAKGAILLLSCPANLKLLWQINNVITVIFDTCYWNQAHKCIGINL
jgi:hypothetical protein